MYNKEMKGVLKMTRKTMYIPAAFAVLLILFTAMSGSFDLMVQKWAGLLGVALILGLMFTSKAKNALKAYTGPLFFAIAAYVVWNGISVFYADLPKAALFELTKLLIAVAVFFIVLVFSIPTKKGFAITSTIFAVLAAFFGIISIDAGSNGPLATAFKAFMGLFTDHMQYYGAFEQGIRITGIFGNANTFAGFMALGIFLSLSLVLNSISKKQRALAIVLLAINALTYILLFSLGSLFMFFFACFIMILTSQKEARLSTFMLMAETVVTTLIFAVVALTTLGASPVLPLAAIVLNAVALWAVDNYIRQPLTTKLAINPKASMTAGIIIALLIVGYIGAALNVTGPITLAPSETVMRAAYLDAGEYSLAAEGDQAATVRIITQNGTDLKVHTSTQLYTGPLSSATFTVPEDSEIVKLYFMGGLEGCDVSKVTYKSSEGTLTGDIKLDYRLLPSIAANRIQDLRANENSIQRLVFFEDGMKLFKQSPIIGHGISGYEEGVASVQDFYYETRYVHNHYIQALCDLGIIGLALFLSILVFCVMSIVKLRKKKGAALFAVPVMAACVFQMFGQALTDLTWSTGPFIVIAFGILAMLIIAESSVFQDDPTEEDAGDLVAKYANEAYLGVNSKVTGAGIASVSATVLSLAMVVLLSLNLYAHYKASTGNCTMDQIATLAKIDQFESDDYKTTYIVTASTYGLTENMDQANKYATQLTSNTEVVLNYLLPFYFNTAQDDKLFDTASIVAENGKASPDVWNDLFNVFDTAVNTTRENPVEILLYLFGDKEYYIDHILGYYRDLQKRNATYLDDAMLEPSNVVFIGKFLAIENLTPADLQKAIDVFRKTIFDSQFAVDADNNTIPDNISVVSGQTVWDQTNGSVQVAKGTTMALQAYCSREGEYTLRFANLAGLEGSTPPRDIAVSFEGQVLAVQYDQNGAYATATLKGAREADESAGIKAARGTSQMFTITFPSGAQIGNVTVAK
jgi:O-antigen ligase